tara:strand:- start:853 stop:987 length:135 start_codon:yes stop_codon:yes gene_type:complete
MKVLNRILYLFVSTVTTKDAFKNTTKTTKTIFYFAYNPQKKKDK